MAHPVRPLALVLLLSFPSAALAAQDGPQDGRAGGEASEGASEVPENGAAEASAPEEEAPAPAQEVPLGPTLVVNGEEVPPLEVKRAIVTGPAGRQTLESAKIQIFIEEEIDRLVKAGAPRERFMVGDEEIDRAIREADELVKKEFPGGEFQDARSLYPFPDDVWRDQLRQTQLFDRVFLPDDPNEYPETTRAALERQTEGFVQQLIEGHEKRMAEGESKPQNMFQQFLRQMVMGALQAAADEKSWLDGIPPEHALVVNGRPIATEDVWRRIQHRVTATDVQKAKLWIAKTMAAEDALRERGVWPTDEESAAAYEDHTAPYADSPFNIPAVAVSFKKFPSPDHYEAYFRIEQGVRRLIADELDDEHLEQHVEARAQNLLGLAKADVEVILCSAYDFMRGAYRPNGWEEAREEAVQVVRKLAAEEPWDEVLEEHSDFFTPPLGRSNAHIQGSVDMKKGRFGLVNRNELIQKIGESDFSTFLEGYSITDAIFFEAEAGMPTQPMKGPHGYYIALVKKRTAPVTKIDIHGPPDRNHRLLVEQDYVATRLARFAAEALAEAEVEGLASQ